MRQHVRGKHQRAKRFCARITVMDRSCALLILREVEGFHDRYVV